MPAPNVTLSKDGHAIDVPADEAAPYIVKGYTAEQPAARADRIAGEQADERDPGAVAAGALGALRGLTFGGSDAVVRGVGAATGDNSGAEQLADIRDRHGVASTIGNVIGQIGPAIATGGASLEGEAGLLARTPAGFISRIGSKVAGLGEAEGVGALAKAGYTAGGAAVEGAAQNAGAYISDVALGDKDLSADGFVGAMGKGAFYGGVAGGALSLSASGLQAARRLLPSAEVTSEAVAASETAARDGLRDSIDGSNTLESSARDTLKSYREQMAASDLETAQALNRIKVARAEEMAQAQTAKLSERAAVAKTKPAMDWLKDFEVPADEGKLADSVVEHGNIAEGSGPTSLEEQLQGTKKALDGGAAPKDLKPTHVEDGLNDYIAKANPQAARLVNSVKELGAARGELMDSWLKKYGDDSALAYDAASPAARRAKTLDWASKAGPDDEAAAHFLNEPENMKTRLGPEAPADVRKAANAAGADAAHEAFTPALADATNVSKSGTEAMARARYGSARAAAKAQDEVHTAFAAGRRTTGAEVVAAQPSIDEQISHALGKSKDVNADIAEMAPKITRYEAAKAEVTEATAEAGGKVAPEDIAHAQALREAQKAAEQKTAQTTADAADQINKLQAGVPAKQLPGGKLLSKGGLIDRVGNIGGAYEMLRGMGVPLPDPKNIAVIGPLLSLYLKAKVIGKVAGKWGGSFAATAEGTIASKAALTQNRMAGAIDTMLSGASKGVARAAAVSGGPTAALAHKLFDDGSGKTKPYTDTPKIGEVGEMYLARAQELTASQKPGAVEAAVKARITTSDPTIVAAIVAAEQRKLDYQYQKMPKPDPTAIPVPGAKPWCPAKADITVWSKSVEAIHDPAAVFESVARGGCASPEAIDAVKSCFPSLYAAGQKQVVTKLATSNDPIPYPRRVAMSQLWGLPLDPSQAPDHAAFLQARYSAPAAAQQPAPVMGQPTIAAPVNFGQRVASILDK